MLQYLSLPDLRHFPPSGKLVTTLFQSTGRASGTSGYVNVTTFTSGNNVKTIESNVYIHTFVSNVTVLSLVKTVPYNVSIFTVSAVLVPYNFDIMSSETRPPLGVNITKVLLDGHNFNVAASMLMASGVEVEFEQDQGGAGITLFVPTDDAFSDLPGSVKFQSLPADEKADVLRFHVLHSYYPLGSLESIVNPVQPTLATEKIGAGRFTLNISKINGSVAIDTGIIQASVTRTVFDQNPVAIFGVSRVLLPGEMFGKNPIGVSKGGGRGGIIAAQPPAKAFTPDNRGEVYGPSSHLTSPPGLSDDVGSKAGRTGVELKIISLMVFVYSFWFLLLLGD
ncbi:hypothetical protein Leryth_002866 [Lithospermum erythrorhizon]|nr:hypothetical protein Leryth_002866 [Lithospermum erythrorhizon]